MNKIIRAVSAALMLLLGSTSADAGQKQSEAYITSRLYMGGSQVIVRKYPAVEHRQRYYAPPAYYYRYYPAKHHGYGDGQCHPHKKAYKKYWQHNKHNHR